EAATPYSGYGYTGRTGRTKEGTRDIPYNNYARAVTRIKSIAINIKAFCLKAYSNAKEASLAN
ncbi:hypothetical protein L249_5495, partial [Ophiocordyceps polyrhachis-furcata BCC 54312]